jgi:predicted metal-dependent hydrolase
LKRTAAEYYEGGIDLFNEGKFFECHEAWEEIWKHSEGEAKLFYQGLIQAAVAILHAQRGNLAGAASMHTKASVKLCQLKSPYMGIALAELRGALKDFFGVALTGAAMPELPKINRVLRLGPETGHG